MMREIKLIEEFISYTGSRQPYLYLDLRRLNYSANVPFCGLVSVVVMGVGFGRCCLSL